MYVDNSIVDFAGRIINNDASNSGGGLYANLGVITLTNATVGGTGTNQQNSIGAAGLNGAGLYLFNNTHATLSNTVVSSNTLSNPSTGYGGGMYVRQGSIITATNSRIERHSLPSAFDGRGAGMYIYDATVTLSNTQVQSNTTQNLGAGARLFGTSTLNVLGGSSFINNRASGGVGGAIAATNLPDINVNNATFQYNFSSSHGGAIYMDAGTLDFTGQWDVRWNSAMGNGGAVAVLGTGDVDFSAGGASDSLLGVNTAGGDGGALYVGNDDTVQLYAASGQQINFNTNHAGGDGGAAYANNGAFFDVYGQIQATSNIADRNGGVFYLSNGSRLWLDDYFSVRPQILVNRAANGGAIYASNSPRVECDGADFGAVGDGNRATAGSGGAIYLSGSTLLADNCVFRTNLAQAGNGGAIAAYTSTVRIDTDYATLQNNLTDTTERAGPNALLATACDPLAQPCSSLSSNRAISSTASNGNGGAIYVNASDLSLNNTYLHRNTAVRGGAIYQENSSARGWISNTLVYSNTSLVSFGAGIRYAGGAMTLTHVTAANNVGGAGFSPGAASAYVYNTIIWGNSVAAFGALAAASCNIDQGGTAGAATNPMFTGPGASENYHLQSGSPAIDACNTGLPADLDNTPRPYGSRYDMGAYEYTVRRTYLPLVVRQ
jgi:predicted outer membrane repeat protein